MKKEAPTQAETNAGAKEKTRHKGTIFLPDVIKNLIIALFLSLILNLILFLS